ncbi:hypothetical protein RND71_015937 [Anisodus tanguticus]|uniref:Cytochrome P450 n=1 Tax=Anisodus tanguticus TaxID=243964 RepID=A0AAE1S7S7_9SOLA|nr:hypothetical protein RND71_015937 [Anisodus tanguticus]
MEFDSVFLYTALAVGVLTICTVLKRVNGWFYSIKFSSKEYRVPPGDMGWPFIGNMLFFFRSFKLGGDLGTFISYFVTRFGAGGMYKSFMFGKPSVIITTPEIVRKVLMDDDNFDLGFPQYLRDLLGQEPTGGTTIKEDKLIRRLTAPIKNHISLSSYFDCIKKIAKSSFEKWADMGEPIELFAEMRRPAFDVLMQVLIGGDQVAPHLLDMVFKQNSYRFSGLHSLPINFPGFAYNKALKARKEIVKVYEEIINERKAMIANTKGEPRTNLLDTMLDTQDDGEGTKLRDGNIVKTLLWYTFGGYESVARVATKAIMHLERNPEFYQKAKALTLAHIPLISIIFAFIFAFRCLVYEEQEDIIKRRSSPNDGLNFDEISQMKYLSKVINETLRMGSTETVLFREANTTVNVNGYSVPKGWKFLTLLGKFHMDPNVYVKPKEFNPSRWDDLDKPASFLPFGIGPKMCPGANLVRLEVSVFLHYYILYYRIEQLSPKSEMETCVARIKKI